MSKEVKLNDIAVFKNGKKKPKETGEIPVYGGNGIFDFTNESNHSDVIIIGRVGAYCGSVHYESQPLWVSDNAIAVKNIEGMSNIDYLKYLLQTLQLNKRSIGTSQPLLTQSILKDIKVTLPSLTEQKKIAVLLSSFDNKIENNNAIIANLEEQAETIFKSWFVDFEPFQDEEFIDSELGRIPKGWKIVKLKEISEEIITGKTPPTKEPKNYGNKMPFVTIPDMHNHVYVTETERSLSDKGVETQKNKVVPKNSIAVSCIATVGLVSLISEDSQTNQQINTVLAEDNVSPYYVYSFMKTQSNYLNAVGSSGSTTKNVNKTTFSNLKLLLPKEDVLAKYHKLCEPIFDYILSVQKQNSKLSEIRDTLLPKLMSGEIRVGEASEVKYTRGLSSGR